MLAETTVGFLNSSNLPALVKQRIQRECGHFILIDEILKSQNFHLIKSKKIALNLLEKNFEIQIEPSKFERCLQFIDNMLFEASRSPSKYAQDLFESIGCLAQEELISEHVLVNFFRNFQRFIRYFLGTKLGL